MIAANHERAGSPGNGKNAPRIGATRNQITNKNKAIARFERHPLEEGLELSPASVNIANDDRAPHGPSTFGTANGSLIENGETPPVLSQLDTPQEHSTYDPK
jgi:hypothetical protein